MLYPTGPCSGGSVASDFAPAGSVAVAASDFDSDFGFGFASGFGFDVLLFLLADIQLPMILCILIRFNGRRLQTGPPALRDHKKHTKLFPYPEHPIAKGRNTKVPCGASQGLAVGVCLVDNFGEMIVGEIGVWGFMWCFFHYTLFNGILRGATEV